MLVLSLLALLPSCIGTVQAQVRGSSHDARPASIEDMLEIELVGPADFSPDGQWLAYTLVPPYKDIQDYSYWLRASGLSGHRIWLRNLSSRQPSRVHPGLNPAASQYLIGFSPSGSHLVVLEHERGTFVLAACPITGPACARFDSMPDIRDIYVAPAAWNERLIWTDDHTFLLPVRTRDVPGSELRNRAATAGYLLQVWDAAWRGTGATASVVSSRMPGKEETWAAGSLVRFDIRTGQEELLADGRHAAGHLSPDHRFLLVSKVGERRRPPPDAGQEPGETHPMFDRLYALQLVDLHEGAVREVSCDCELDPDSVAWSASGQRFVFFAWEEGGNVTSGRYRLLERESGGVLLQTPEDYQIMDRRGPGNTTHPAGPVKAVPVRDGLVALARPAGSNRFDWYYFDKSGHPENLSAALPDPSGEVIYAADESAHILTRDGIYRLVPGEPPHILPGLPVGPLQKLVYRSNVAHGWANEFFFRYQRTRADLSPSLVLVQPGPEGDGAIVSVDLLAPATAPHITRPRPPDARVLAARSEGELLMTVKDGSATRLLLAGSGGELSELAVLNQHLNQIQHPPVRTLTYALRGEGGKEQTLDGCYMLPPGYQAGHRYPVVIDVYPIGISPTCKSLQDMPWIAPNLADLWTARGFVYMMPPVPLNMAATAEGPIAGMDELLEQALDALVSEGVADPERAVLFGFSQGGAASLYVATQSNRFAATISMNGWADFFSHYFGGRGLMRYFHLNQNGGDNRWRYECEGEGADHRCPFGFGASALDDPGRYTRLSPVALARGVSAPVLLVHSDWDYIDMAQYDEMFGALYRAGKEARYVRYWGEGHGPSSPANLRDLWQQIDTFLLENGFVLADCEDQDRCK